MQKYQVFNAIVTHRLVTNMCQHVDNSVFYNGWQTRIATMTEMKNFRAQIHQTNQVIDIDINDHYVVFHHFMQALNHTYQNTANQAEFLCNAINDVDNQINPTYPELGAIIVELIQQIMTTQLNKNDCYINLFGASLFVVYHQN